MAFGKSSGFSSGKEKRSVKAERRAQKATAAEAAHADDQDGEEPPLAQPAPRSQADHQNYALNVGTSSLREALQQLQAGIVARLSLDRPEC